MLGVPLLGAIPEDQQVIVATNRGEPLVLQKKLTLSGIAFENAARRLIGKQVGASAAVWAGGEVLRLCWQV
jgi:septum site-determining protein MinD